MSSSPVNVEIVSPSYNDRPRCDCLSLAVESSNESLEKRFGERMKDFGQSKGYRSVAVLLLSWEGSDLNENGKVDQEVDSLAEVFQTDYHYTVVKGTIAKEGPASWSTVYQLLPFLMQHDSNNALLIIYYAGHGFKGASDSHFELARTSNDDDSKRKELNTIIWDDIENPLLKTQADLFVIFDCCFAGDLALPRGPSPRKIFSFLGSTQDNQTARGPGPRSFTRALIHALKQLAHRDDGFTVMELISRIRNAPHFKDIDQRPVEGFRGDKPKRRMLQIRRLPRAQGPNTTAEVTKHPAGMDEIQYLLRLNFAFSEPPTESHMSDFVDELAHLIKSSDSPVRNVTWGMLAKKRKSVKWPKFKAAVHEVLRKRRPSILSQIGSSAMLQVMARSSRPTSPARWHDDSSTAVANSPAPQQAMISSPLRSVISLEPDPSTLSRRIRSRRKRRDQRWPQGVRRSPRKLKGKG